MSYASKRSVAKAQGLNEKTSNDARINRIRHRGMQKSHIQITPDGKVIQHYVMSSRDIAFKKAMAKAVAEAQAKEENKELVESVSK